MNLHGMTHVSGLTQGRRPRGQALGRAVGMFVAIVVCGALTAAPAWASDASEAEAEDCSSAMNIFLQEGGSGSFVEEGSGVYTLTIEDVLPYTIYFADRPHTDSGFVPLDEFIAGFNWTPWNPPNAAIMLREGDDDEDIVVVQLGNPRYDEAAQTLVYSAMVTADYEAKSEMLERVAQTADMSIPETFGPVVLVIDDCPCLWAPAQGCEDSGSCNSTSWKTFPNFACVYDGRCCEHCYLAPDGYEPFWILSDEDE